ncbi:MAG: hypothetical protein V4598_15260 [Bdellovibrionota bacterium]
MKKLFITALMMATASWGAQAQTTAAATGIAYTDQYIVLDLQALCWSKRLYTRCDLNDKGVPFVITGVQGSSDAAGPATSKIATSVPVGKVDWNMAYGVEYNGTFTGNNMTGKVYSDAKSIVFPGVGYNEVNFNASYPVWPMKVYLNTGIPTYLKESFTGAAQLLKSSYVGVLRNVTMFRGEIAKSHRGHLERFMSAIQDGINLIDAKDASGKLLYSVMDWRIQENSRLVVVFGTVLNELLTDYDDVDRLKISIQAMRTLVDQLRLAYGWQRGLAGTVSKASSSLIDVVRLELQELASIKMAMGAGDFTVYMDLLRITRGLQAKVDASRSGDMKAQREIFELLDKWNAKEWQDEMARLLNAGPDFKNLVVPKLSMLIFAMESISDLTEMEFIIPDRATLTK